MVDIYTATSATHGRCLGAQCEHPPRDAAELGARAGKVRGRPGGSSAPRAGGQRESPKTCPRQRTATSAVAMVPVVLSSIALRGGGRGGGRERERERGVCGVCVCVGGCVCGGGVNMVALHCLYQRQHAFPPERDIVNSAKSEPKARDITRGCKNARHTDRPQRGTATMSRWRPLQPGCR